MSHFRQFLADEELCDVYLHGHRYTWSSEQDSLTLTRIDRVLCTSGWSTSHPQCLLCCLASTVSDHCPLLLDCKAWPSGTKRFYFERFWPKMEGYLEVVEQAWSSKGHGQEPFHRLVSRLKCTARRLQSWSAKSTGNISRQTMVARELIARFDQAQDFRQLCPTETWLRRKLKAAYLGLASLERSLL